MGQKDNNKKANKIAVKEAKKVKQQEKSYKKKKKDQNGEDIEAILASLDSEKSSITNCPASSIVTKCDQPSPRAHCSLTCIPSGELVMFGGEYYDGKKIHVYNDLFRWNVERNEWRRIDCQIKPKPRCSHQAVYYRECIYIFGGEFSTVDQFYHFNDFWCFDLKSNNWKIVEFSGAPPSPRSGHRMVIWRNILVCFGGFYDTIRSTNFFNDLYLFSFQEKKWTKVEYSKTMSIPDCRSASLMAVSPSADCVYMFGGFSKVKDTARNVSGKYHRDGWVLNMKPLIHNKIAQPLWEKLKKSASSLPIRSGGVMSTYNNLAIMFGGVFDEDDGGLNLRSVFYNDLYAFDMNRLRWYSLTMQNVKTRKIKERKKYKKTPPNNDTAESVNLTDLDSDTNSECESSEDELNDFDYQEDSFGYIDENGKLVRIKIENESEPFPELPFQFHDAETSENRVEGVNKASMICDSTIPDASMHEECVEKTNEYIAEELPLKPFCEPATKAEIINSLSENVVISPRYNPCVVISGNQIFVYGGLVEIGRKEITLDDCWTFNLHKRDKWTRLLSGHMEEQAWEESSSDEDDSQHCITDSNSDEELSTSLSNEENEDTDSENEFSQNDIISLNDKSTTLRNSMQKLKENLNLEDSTITPLLDESLRSFFDRTKLTWMMKVQNNDSSNGKDQKLLKRLAFQEAEKRYSELRPYLDIIAQLQECQLQSEVTAIRNKPQIITRR